MVRAVSPALGGALLVTVIAMLVYARTLAPTVTLVDSGELIVAARNLGVAHPPGFPLYVLLAHAATRVPLGNVAQRVNAASALYAALAACATGLAFRELVLGLGATPLAGASRREKRRARKGPVAAEAPAPHPLGAGAVAVIATGLLFAFSRTLWGYATVAEVYTLNTLLVASCLALVLRWRRAGRPPTLLVAAAVAFALGLGVHHVTVALTLPGLAVLVLASHPRVKARGLVAPALVVALVVGLLYATLPLLAARRPVLGWGDTTSVERLFRHVSGQQYSAFLSISVGSVAPELVASLGRIGREFGTPPLVPALALVGFAALWRRDRAAFAGLGALVAVNLAFTSLYTIAEDKDAYHLPAFLGIAMAAGVGAAALRARLAPRFLAAGAVIVAALPLVPLLSSFESRDRSRFRVAADYADNALRAAAPGALVLTSDWQLYSPLLYVQEVEERRGDVAAIDVSLLRRSWYVSFVERRFPDLMGRVRPQARAFLEDLLGWEADPEPYDHDPQLNRRINERFHAMLTALVTAQLQRGRVYATSEVVMPRASPDPALATLLFQAWTLRPRGILFELSSEKGWLPLEPLDLETRGLEKRAVEVDEVVALKVRPAYLVMLVNRGYYLAAARDPAGARQAFERALALDPDQPQARQALAALPGTRHPERSEGSAVPE